jgi:hypothetical protein
MLPLSRHHYALFIELLCFAIYAVMVTSCEAIMIGGNFFRFPAETI